MRRFFLVKEKVIASPQSLQISIFLPITTPACDAAAQAALVVLVAEAEEGQ